MNKYLKKSLVLISAAAVTMPLAVNSYAQQVGYRNISGNDRFSTAVSISRNGWANGSENVILVNSDAVADSLSVAPLASAMKAPVLLTRRGQINPETMSELTRLGAKKITIIGGEGSVSSSVEKNLISSGFSTNRISGSTRVETSLKIAEKLKEISQKSFNDIFIVNGMKGLADAAGIGSVAAKKGSPILFVNGDGYEIAKKTVDSMSPENIYLIGGQSSIPDKFQSIGANVERISGKDRQETNINMINKFYLEYNTVYIADDGSKNPSKLIDSVLINAGIIASNNVENNSNTGKQTLESKEDSNVVKDTNKEIASKSEDAKQNEQNNVSEVSVEDVSTNSNVKKDVKSTSTSLQEGPVMLVSENKGLTYRQMKFLNGDNNSLNSIVQVSGGNRLLSEINKIKTFIDGKDNENIKKIFDKMMNYENVKIEYTVGGKSTVLDGNMILNMIETNGSSLRFNKDKVRNFVSGINLSGVAPTGDAYVYRKNGNIIIDRNGSGAKIDLNGETEKLLNMLESGKSYANIVPKYTKAEIPKGASSLGKTYVQISLKKQNMKVWKNGKAVINTPIVSGNPNRRMATPPGIFKIKKKMKNAVLRGPGYASPVKYWIPFNGSIGIHDAYWQPVYGGSRYLSHGSHGCINTPLEAVGKLYNHVNVGTPVIVQ